MASQVEIYDLALLRLGSDVSISTLESATITAFAQATSSTTTVTVTHSLAIGDVVIIDGTTNYDGMYDVISISTTVSFVITKVYVADDATGTAYWNVTDDTHPTDLCDAVWDAVLDEALNMGPEKGWRFARWSYYGVDRDSITITSIANSSTSGDITITGTHSLVVGDMVELTGDTGYDDTYVVNAISTTTTFDVTATYVATGTGTAYWTSNKYGYRYAYPTCTKVTSVNVGGIELTDWVRRGQWILTNLEDTEVDIDYIHDASALTIANFPPHFVDVVWRLLAVHLAYSLVQSRVFGEQLKIELETIHLPRAIAMDARVEYVKEESHSWTAIGRTTTIIE